MPQTLGTSITAETLPVCRKTTPNLTKWLEHCTQNLEVLGSLPSMRSAILALQSLLSFEVCKLLTLSAGVNGSAPEPSTLSWNNNMHGKLRQWLNNAQAAESQKIYIWQPLAVNKQ